MTNQTDIRIEVGKRLEKVKGSPRQAYIKAGKQRLGTFLLWGNNPGSIRLNPAGKFWLHNLIEGGEQS